MEGQQILSKVYRSGMGLLVVGLKICMDRGWPIPLISYKVAGYYLLSSWQYEQAEMFFSFLQKKYPHRIEGYEGLIWIAQKKGLPERLLERLSATLQKFPDRLDFLHLQIKTWVQIGEMKKAQQAIEGNTGRFSGAPSWSIIKATFYRAQYDFPSAQKILDKEVSLHPGHAELRLLQADNLFQMGEVEAAGKSVQVIRRQFGFDKRLFTEPVALLYIHALLVNGDTEQLWAFFAEALAADVHSPEIISGYCQLLMGTGDYRSAGDFVEKKIREGGTDLPFGDYAMLFFEKEKIINTKFFVEQGPILPTGSFEQKGGLGISGKTVGYLEKHPGFDKTKNILLAILQQLEQLAARRPSLLQTAVSPSETCQVAQRVLSAIQQKRAFSFIRLGDGEGHFLPYPADLQPIQKNDRASSQRIWWGKEKINEDNWRVLETDYLAAIQQADLLGIPCLWRSCRSFLQIPQESTSFTTETRGLKAIFDQLLSPAYQPIKGQVLTSCHIHSHLEDLGLWDVIFNEITDCSVISCHASLAKVLKEKHRIEVRKFYTVPPEFKYAKRLGHRHQTDHPHFPIVFNKICSEIEVAYPGEVFLVAAGFLGKLYCQTIKEKGGIAIDVGSAVDYWLNYSTRVWIKYPIHKDLKRRLSSLFQNHTDGYHLAVNK